MHNSIRSAYCQPCQVSPIQQFRNISLKYAPNLPPALDGVSFTLPHAAKVGVVGRTGSGKSTLLVALFRLIQPCDGAIVLNQKGILVCLSLRNLHPAL